MSKVNIIGAACIDILIKGYDKNLLLSNKHKVDEIKTYFGGDGLNEAVCLNNFGIDTKLVTILGNDYHGKQIINFLNEKNIKYNSNIIKDNIDTYISIVLIDNDGERTFIGNKNGSVRKLSLDDINIDDDCKLVSFASLFISEELKNNDLEILFSKIKEKDIILCVDTSTAKHNERITDLSCLKYVDYFFLNEFEAKLLCNNDDIYKIESEIYKTGVKNVIIKCGSNGCFYKGKYHKYNLDDKPLDTTGAGDSFVSGFIYSLLNNNSIEQSLQIANKFGYNAIKYIGGNTWVDYIDKGDFK